MTERDEEVLHYKTQENQPYGSESRKCSRCGTRLWIPADGIWTDCLEVWEDPPIGFKNCSERTIKEKRRWDLLGAVIFIQNLTRVITPSGYAAGITGSVLTSGESTKDLDVILYPLQSGLEDEQSLMKALAMIGMKRIYGANEIHQIWRRKGSSDTKRVECWKWEQKRVDLFFLK
ncbi:MAG TPA: hypothetical protein VIE65_15300 [Methylobacter sp.]